MKPQILLNLDQVQGIFDADGSFNVKVYVGKVKSISFHLNIVFTQKEKDVLQAVLDCTQVSIGKTISVRLASQSERSKESAPYGLILEEHSISFAFSSDGGKFLLQGWKNKAPAAPTKYLDYRIAIILCQVSETKTTTALDVLNRLFPTRKLKNERVAALALLFLRYCMSNAAKKCDPKLDPIETFYEKLKATPEEINQSSLIGQELYAPIQADFQKHVDTLTISDQTFSGLHIGDGSFQIQTEFNNTSTSFRAKFTWSYTDCIENYPLLMAIKQLLVSKSIDKDSIGVVNYTTYYKIRIQKTSAISKVLELLQKCGTQDWPNARKIQFEGFSKAFMLYHSKNFKQDLSLLEEFIHIKWTFNAATNSKKKGSLENDLISVRKFFYK